MPLKIDKKKLRGVAQKFKLDLIILFGSKACHQQKKSSDLDLAVRTGIKERGFEWEFGLIRALVESLDEANLDLIILNEADSLLLFEIASEGVPLYEKEEGLFVDFQVYAVKRNNDAQKFYRLEEEYILS